MTLHVQNGFLAHIGSQNVAKRSVRTFMIIVSTVLIGCHTPAFAQSKVSFPNRVCNVKDFGAIGAKLKPDTIAFQKAIDSCSEAGGGTVEVPRGWYLIGPIEIKSNVRLNFAKYSEVRFETEPSLYGTTKAPVSPEGKSAGSCPN